MTEEYINISELKNIKKIKEENIQKKPIYQIQCNTNSNLAKIFQVGLFNELHDVTINNFKYLTNFQCILISCLYDDHTLNQTTIDNVYPLVKLLINLIEDDKMIPMAYIRYNLHANIDKDKNIMDYISTPQDIKLIDCTFSITMHYDNKYFYIDQFENYTDNRHMMTQLVESLKHEEVDGVIRKFKIE